MASDEKDTTPGTPAAPAQPAPAPGPAPGRGWWIGAFVVVAALAAGEAVIIFRNAARQPAPPQPAAAGRKVLYWQDSMHPQYKSDKPGKAPDCGMDLVPVYEEPAPKAASGERKVLYWQDPMNPGHRSDKPGKAPDGMDLVPVYGEELAAGTPPPEGAFRITPEKQQLIGVQYGIVARRPLTKTIRAVARIAYDETRIVRVHSKIEGWIDKVSADFTGQLVTKGQPLISVYSPDLVATQEEYLLAMRARDKLGNSSYTEVSNGANSLLEAARRRLELWDVSDQQIAEVERIGKPIRAVTLFSPASGFVLTRNSYANQRITPETELYTIADLSTVWAIADFYENEVHDVRLGQKVVLTLSSFPGRKFTGKVGYIYPQLDDTTRTLKVRAEFLNPNFALKPDMYADAELNIDYGDRLAVPQEAVLDSGMEKLVFVARPDGYFEPRRVVLGDKVDDQVIVLSGLKAGEKVVTSANFLVDSESGLKAAASGMTTPMTEHK